MKFTQLSKPIAVATAIAAPLLLTGAAPAFAAKPPFAQPCKVGSAAYPTIQSAVDQAGCVAINVPAGTFNENVRIPRDVEIRGAGPENTIVRGIQGPVIDIVSIAGHYPVVTLKGMTITGGKPMTAPAQCTGGGGGVNISLATVTIKDAFITGNEIRVNSCTVARPGQGGGINSFRSTLTLKDSVVSDNVADRCGGIRIGSNNTAAPPSVTTIADSIIADNVADGSGLWYGAELGIGGGICITQLGTVTLRDSTVTGNSANTEGGGIHINAAGTVLVKDSTVSGNSAGSAGGGIYNDGGVLVTRDSSVTGNTPDDLWP